MMEITLSTPQKKTQTIQQNWQTKISQEQKKHHPEMGNNSY